MSEVYIHVWGRTITGDDVAVAVPKSSFHEQNRRSADVVWQNNRWESRTHVIVVITVFAGSFVPGLLDGRRW